MVAKETEKEKKKREPLGPRMVFRAALRPDDPTHKRLTELSRAAHKMFNYAAQAYWEGRVLGVKYVRRGCTVEREKDDKLALGTSIYRALGLVNDVHMPGGSVSAIAKKVYDTFQAKWKDIQMGAASVPSWKWPSPIPVRSTEFDITETDVETKDEDGKVKKVVRVPAISVTLYGVGSEQTGKAVIPLYPPQKSKKRGRIADHSYWWSIINLMKKEPERRRNLQILWDKKKRQWMALISYEAVKKEINWNGILGLDLGIVNPMVCAVSEGYGVEFIGDPRAVIARKQRYQATRKALGNETRGLKHSENAGGKGWKRRNKALVKLRDREARWLKTFHQQAAARVVKTMKRLKVGTLAMEALKNPVKEARETDKDDRTPVQKMALLWQPYAAKMAVMWAVKKAGMQVIEVPPYYTSQRCSKCGHIDPENRKSQSKFKCSKCGHEEHADSNAGRNIAAAAEGKWFPEKEWKKRHPKKDEKSSKKRKVESVIHENCSN